MARPRKKVDEILLEKLSKLQLSDKVMADIVGISVDTLHRRFADKIEIWRSKSKGKIAEVLFDEGINKREPWALKALCQKHLDYADKQDVDHSGTGTVIKFICPPNGSEAPSEEE